MEWYFRFGFGAESVPNYDCRDSDRRSGRVSYLAGVLFLLYGTVIEATAFSPTFIHPTILCVEQQFRNILYVMKTIIRLTRELSERYAGTARTNTIGRIPVLQITLYIFVLMVLLRKKYRESSCYKIMISLVIYDAAAIAVISLLTGYFWLVGANYCTHPDLQFISGAVVMGCWSASCINGLLLAFNRVLDIWSKTLTYKVFDGSRTYIVLTLPLLYFLYFTFFTPPLMFNSDHMAWFYDTFTGNHHRSAFISYAHIVNNFLIVTLTCFLYINYSRVLFRNSTISRSLFMTHKSYLIQTSLICFMNLMAAMPYVSMDFFPAPDWFALASYIFWNFGHGTPAVVYLFLNQTIQQEILQLLKNVRKYSGSNISTTSDAAVYKPSTDSQFRLHGKGLPQSRIFRIVPQRLIPASKL